MGLNSGLKRVFSEHYDVTVKLTFDHQNRLDIWAKFLKFPQGVSNRLRSREQDEQMDVHTDNPKI